MQKPDDTFQRSPRRSQSRSIFFWALLIVLLILVAGVAYLYFSSHIKETEPLGNGPAVHGRSETSPPARESMEADDNEHSQSGTEPLDAPLSADDDSLPPASSDTEPDNPQSAPLTFETRYELAQCAEIGGELHEFFNHLDQEEYIQGFSLNTSAQEYFTKLMVQLLNNPPVVSRETDALYTILKNMAHFFRIIGKDNILLLKGIMDREREKIEDIAAALFQWVHRADCQSDQFSLNAPLEKLYEYAGFFLNTMGGRSYLFRRDSRSRLLVNYYSILIISQADHEGLNQYGIDLNQHLEALITEMDVTNHLIYKENYLERLESLLEKYSPSEN